MRTRTTTTKPMPSRQRSRGQAERRDGGQRVPRRQERTSVPERSAFRRVAVFVPL